MDYNNHFPHDGEHGRNCAGYGCDCDEKNYGHQSGRRNSRGNGSVWIVIAIVVMGSVVGALNELIGAVLMIVLAFFVITCR